MFVKNNYLSSSVITVLIAFAGQANAGSACPSNTTTMKVEGKIFNNAINPGTTLGVVHLDLKPGGKVECGIMGSGGVGSDGTTISFVHTLVCDDKVAVTSDTGQIETVHSQITLNTSGRAVLQACHADIPGTAGFHGTFNEISVPMPMSGRGKFQGVTQGTVIIDGTINCQFALDMKFKGQICIPSPN